MDIEGLVDFMTLAGAKSFSRAAQLRNVTQPAFSRRIRALEENVGADLVDRKAKGFRLTPAGERFLLHARNIVDLSGRAVEEVRSLTTRLVTPVYVSAPSYLSKTFFPAWYRKMQDAVPGLSMRLSYQRATNALDDLRKGIADFALIMRAKEVETCYDFEGLSSVTVGRERMVAVHARHTKTRALLMYEQGSYLSALAEATLGKKSMRGEVVFESSSTGMLKEMALAGFGVAVLPESMAEDDLAQGFLVQLEDTPPLKCDILFVRGPRLSHKKAEKVWESNSPRGSSALRG